MRDSLILSFLTCQPPDRVGVLRKLRYAATLKRGEASGAWVLDLTECRGCHKTAKFYGPSVTTINPLIAVWLSAYLGLLALTGPTRSRPSTSSLWATTSRAASPARSGRSW